jgi:hypothetical protein
MPNPIKESFVEDLTKRYGKLNKIGNSHSLFDLSDGSARIYIRFSKVHAGGKTFFGLREDDLRLLEGHSSFICYLWTDQLEPLIIPFSEYEEVFHSISPAGDGQFKAQIFLHEDGTQLYIANAGRFNIEGHFGWEKLENVVGSDKCERAREFSHSEIQTYLGAIGDVKSFDVWIPMVDRNNLKWADIRPFRCCNRLPDAYRQVEDILQEIDVIWIRKGSGEIRGLFEVEHSTTIYSGLLRLNDVHLTAPNLRPQFSIVSNEERRALFVRQVNRPTFRASGLIEFCTFLDYFSVYSWLKRISSK